MKTRISTRVPRVVPLIALGAAVACEPSTPTDARHQPPIPEFNIVQQEGPRRDDTPWRGMTDAELTTKVAEAGGRVFIGFKDPGASGGVDERGRVLVSETSVAAAKAWLRALNVNFEIEFINMPTVVAHILAELVPQLRAIR